MTIFFHNAFLEKDGTVMVVTDENRLVKLYENNRKEMQALFIFFSVVATLTLLYQ